MKTVVAELKDKCVVTHTEHGLQSSNVILDVGGKSVGTAGDFRTQSQKRQSGGKRDVLVRVKTAENTPFIAVPIG